VRKHYLFTAVLLLALVLALIGGTSAPVAANNGLKVQLAMILDGSSSISDANWTIMVNGLADAVEDPECIPQDGSAELTVIQFGGYYVPLNNIYPSAQLQLGPVVITEANASIVANQIRATYEGGTMEQMGGWTPTACGIRLAADTLRGSTKHQAGPQPGHGWRAQCLLRCHWLHRLR